MFLQSEGGVDPTLGLSAGTLEKQVENSEGGPGQARARAIGRGGAGEIS